MSWKRAVVCWCRGDSHQARRLRNLLKNGTPRINPTFFFSFFGADLFILGFRVCRKWKRSLFRPGSRKLGIGVVAEPFAKWDPRIKIRLFFLLQFSSF
jgi:hypothetical protein